MEAFVLVNELWRLFFTLALYLYIVTIYCVRGEEKAGGEEGGGRTNMG